METLPLIGKLLSVNEYKEQYYGYIKEIMAMLENFEDRVTELKEIIKPYVEKDPTSFYSIEDFEKATTLKDTDIQETKKPSENPAEDFNPGKLENNQKEGQPFNDRHMGGGQPFGGTNSIINCIVDRLKNLNEQFNGTADKTTDITGGQGGGQPGGDFTPPQFGEMPENGQPPKNQDGNMQHPKQPDFKEGQNPRPDGENPPNGFPGEHNNQNSNPDIIRVHVDGHIV